MAATTTAHKNGRGSKAHPNNNSSSVADILKDADRLLDMVMSVSPPADNKRKQHKSHGADQRAGKLRDGERRVRSPVETTETVKKQKHSLDDDGSRHRGDDDDVDGSSSSCKDHAKSKPDGRPVEKTCRLVAPKPTLFGLKGRAPLAEPENSTLTPEPERDMGRRLLLLKCDSDKFERNEKGDGVDSSINEDEADYDDVDGPSDEDDGPVDEKERAIKEVAEKLRNIGDDVDRAFTSSGILPKSGTTINISMVAIDIGIQELTSNLTYEKFQDVVNRSVGNETGIQQMAAMFCLARAAVKHWGSGTKAVAEVKDIANNYFRNNVASWVSQNGWSWVAQHL